MSERYNFIISTITQAGQILLDSQKNSIKVSTKNNDPRDLVTNVDSEVNNFLQKSILSEYPDDKIYSEETGGQLNYNETFWSIDPIDGTSNFARGIPHFSVVVAFIENGEVMVGAVYNPITRELFSFKKGEGAFLNGERISVSNINILKDAYFLLHIGRKTEIQEWGLSFQRFLLSGVKKNINLGSSSLDLCFLASGRVEGVVYGTMTTLDISVALSIVREAGGEVYNLNGEPVKLLKNPQETIGVSNKNLFNELKRAGVL